MNIFKFVIKIVVLLVLIALQQGLGSELLKSLLANSSIVHSLISFLIFWTSINLVIRFCQFIYRKRKKFGHKYSDNVIIGLQNIYYLLSGIGVAVMVLGFFGFHFHELLTSLSIVAAAIAIISKELVTDVICGFNISFSRELAIGDYVRIGDQKGKVVDLNIHKIVLQNDEDDIIYIANTKAYYSDIVNFTQKEIRKYNLDFIIANSVNLSKAEIEAKINEVLYIYSPHYEAKSSNFRIANLGKDEVRYKLQFKLIRIDPVLEQEIKANILNEIHKMIQRKVFDASL
ncbi:MAG: mechanosensitive ion channel [Saprospiraceae bacterium]|nr:mechanosensitive ion channel [Saprospiraceae bacterium]MBK8449898.1 mechanosensitive ion channel [Saprospiraceae bacterium]MBK9221448.1 mechanosensitive ion channel [Saprospiraceae bacterium]MBK9721614.1 mechanosensitive ion channel [Saprospiraceae bacterium]MBK9728679.1 mechanosensitive ion channel [Saprospiraceae bacterium]